MKTKNKLITLLVMAISSIAIIVSCSKDEGVATENKPLDENAIVDEVSVPIPMPEVGFDVNKLYNSNQKWGYKGHIELIRISAKQWGLSDTRANKMGDAANYPDTKDKEGTLPLTQQWRHGYVFNCADGKFSGWGKADWWCNNVIGGTGWKEDSKSSCFYFYPGDYPNGDYALGYASHYLADIGNAWHTTGCLMSQITHNQYEDWVEANWSAGWNFSASIDKTYYSVTDPAATVRQLAKESYNVSSQMNSEFIASKITSGVYVSKGTSTLVSLTRTRVRDTGRYVKGLIKYTLDHEKAW